ncbi:hemin-binding periplasmic protein [Halobacteriovorax marinus SJ]|uniref:Hemin-binding periplasmic protein n=1 Tax=Halobacteriovorax marinus (strain ATCC BAA-682 / DSM 15412 / SJ) TaxID=862908 RepID=E1WX14_HALMS|nr:ABC transporter substrate-binding protein [Halobacteriovorax marinus]CBW25715.1 hemin-binding periplasmic protein [Halobacteriovorax marinus SJ]
MNLYLIHKGLSMKLHLIALHFFLFLSMNTFSAEKRIIVSGAAVAEVVSQLGEAANIIARDRTSVVVEEIAHLKDLGMPSQMNAEVIISMKPDLFLYGSKNKNEKLVGQLNAAGIKSYEVRESDSVKNILEKIDSVSSILDIDEDRVRKLKSEVESNLTKISKLNKIKSKSAVFIYARGANHIFMAGKKTPANEMMNLIGISNAFNEFDGFKPISLESLVKANPDYIIMLKSGVRGLKNIWNIPGLKHTTAGKNKQLIETDTLPFLGFVPETLPLIMSLNKSLSK